MSRKLTNYNVDSKEFARVWQSSTTADEAAKKLGMPKSIAFARASYLRRKGAELKYMRGRGVGSRPNLDIAKINKMIRDINQQTGEQHACSTYTDEEFAIDPNLIDETLASIIG